MWCAAPAQEIEIAGFNLPNNDRKLGEGGGRDSLCDLELRSCPLNREN